MFKQIESIDLRCLLKVEADDVTGEVSVTPEIFEAKPYLRKDWLQKNIRNLWNML